MDAHIAKHILLHLKIISAVWGFIALAATGYRLYKRRHKLWADDLWALFAAVVLIIQVTAVFLHIPPPSHLPHVVRIAVYYLRATTFYLIVWASRLSILFSIVRIESSATRRKLLLSAAAMFFIAALLLVAQLFWVCESRPRSSWKSHQDPQCDLPRQVAIFQLVSGSTVFQPENDPANCAKADVTSDAILIFAPWPLFRSLVDKSLGHKLTIIFSICVVPTIVSLVHAGFILKGRDIGIQFTGIVECCLSLIVANIPVIITTTMDIVGQPEPGATAEFSSIFWLGTSGTMQLQTVGQHHPHDVTLPPAESKEPFSDSQKDLTKFQSHPYDTTS
ncbi:hypothetical protein MSAN_01201200 [Mycena sanguinolenta]|uniref:Integral membrane protein n=1 Tax=Mycena sanguinolenta TaxID=230812 RepID=A0A8H6YIK7_9AGAR|nr:hypothetical protein MSAN_01201200 [Mycena sanguinolenta]